MAQRQTVCRIKALWCRVSQLSAECTTHSTVELFFRHLYRQKKQLSRLQTNSIWKKKVVQLSPLIKYGGTKEFVCASATIKSSNSKATQPLCKTKKKRKIWRFAAQSTANPAMDAIAAKQLSDAADMKHYMVHKAIGFLQFGAICVFHIDKRRIFFHK